MLGAQDPKLAKWWAQAANYRRSGTDRLLVPAPWTRTIEELCADGVTGECYAHEQVSLKSGTSAEFLELVRTDAVAAYEPFGWELAGAWETAMVADNEAFLLWAIPTWEAWADLEKAQRTDQGLVRWRAAVDDLVEGWHRFLLVDAPLSPFRTGRQPARSDRIDYEDL